jgi:hypothetical protein
MCCWGLEGTRHSGPDPGNPAFPSTGVPCTWTVLRNCNCGVYFVYNRVR